MQPNPSQSFYPKRSTLGFTLLEMMLVLLITTLLVGVIFGIVRSVTQFSDSLATEQKSDARLYGLTEMMQSTFRSLPAHAVVRLQIKQVGTTYLSELTLIDAPAALTQQVGSVTVLATEETASGYLRLVLKIYSHQEALDKEQGRQDGGVSVVLLDDISHLEWRFYQAETEQWIPVWNENLSLAPLLTSLLADPLQQLESDTDSDAEGDSSPEDNPTPSLPLPTKPPSISNIPGIGGKTGANADTARPNLIELILSRGIDEKQRWVFWVPPIKKQ